MSGDAWFSYRPQEPDMMAKDYLFPYLKNKRLMESPSSLAPLPLNFFVLYEVLGV
jgi:hypothetical protein